MENEFKPYKQDDMGDYYQHPSFGTMVFNRAQGSSTKLFGSSIEHQNIITLEISSAELCRHLSNDYIFSRERIIELAMSSTQFANAITGFGCGSGIPVTIRWIKGDAKTRPEPPFQNKVAQFNDEFQNKMTELSETFNEVIKLADETHAQKRLVKAIELLKGRVQSNFPFINTQFSEQMEHTVKEAKGEVEGFINTMVRNYGIEAIRNQAPKIAEPSETQLLELPKENKNGG